MRVLVANGVNLDLLGQREPEIYGASTLKDIEKVMLQMVENSTSASKIQLEFVQSNDITEYLGFLDPRYDWTIMNPGAWTHTSLALRDRILALQINVIEVHCSNPELREEFRRFSYLEDIAKERFCGEGAKSYEKALEFIQMNIKQA